MPPEGERAAAGGQRRGAGPEVQGRTGGTAATGDAPWRRAQARGVDLDPAVGLGAVDAAQPHSRAAGPAPDPFRQFVAQHRQRILDLLEGLDRQVGGVGHVDLDAVEAVLG